MKEDPRLLQQTFENAGISLTAHACDQFMHYHHLLSQWNKRMNLISPGDEKRIITRHFIESAGLLLASDFPAGSLVMDLGSGAGFPGIPIKIIRDDLHMTLVESKKKKARFLSSIIHELSLTGIEVLAERAEEIDSARYKFDIIITRAVADLRTVIRWSRHLIRPEGGTFIFLKGPDAEAEITLLRKSSLFAGVTGIACSEYKPCRFSSREKPTFLIEVDYKHP